MILKKVRESKEQNKKTKIQNRIFAKFYCYGLFTDFLSLPQTKSIIAATICESYFTVVKHDL